MNTLPRTKCTRCSGRMQSRGLKQVQLGKFKIATGPLSNLIQGALEVEIFTCANCGKVDFYCNE